MIRTSGRGASRNEVVRTYKSLSQVERAFRCMKSTDLQIRPLFHRLEDRVRTHVFLCMLAYYVEWHMRTALAPILFDDHEPDAAEALRSSVVAPAKRSPAARREAASKRTDDDLPVHSLGTLLSDLATLSRVRYRVTNPATNVTSEFERLTEATPLQRRALDLLGVRLT